MITLSMVAQTLGVFCCLGITFAVMPGLYGGILFSWHPLLMALGYLGFMTEGILAAVKFRNLDGGPRVLGIQNHLWIQVASTVCVTLGFGAIFWNKVLHGKVHFKSLHGKVGLIAFVLTLLAPVLGACSFRKLGIITKFPEPWQPTIKWIHRMLSVFTWVLALVTMQLPLPHKAVFQGLWCRAWQVGVALLCVAMISTLRARVGKAALPTTLSRSRLGSLGNFNFPITKTR